jgi:hypothetical protein
MMPAFPFKPTTDLFNCLLREEWWSKFTLCESDNGELYVSTAAGNSLAIHMLVATGNVNNTLISIRGRELESGSA